MDTGWSAGECWWLSCGRNVQTQDSRLTATPFCNDITGYGQAPVRRGHYSRSSHESRDWVSRHHLHSCLQARAHAGHSVGPTVGADVNEVEEPPTKHAKEDVRSATMRFLARRID